MKVTASIFGEDGTKISIPMYVYRMHQFYIQHITTLMYMHGIAELEHNVTHHNLFPAVTTKMDSMMNDQIPKELAAERTEIAVALKQLMLRAGIQRLRIEPSAEEVTKIRAYWHYVQNGAPDTGEVALAAPMPVIADPTSEKVDFPPTPLLKS
jgi:predicted transcriptional regulator